MSTSTATLAVALLLVGAVTMCHAAGIAFLEAPQLAPVTVVAGRFTDFDHRLKGFSVVHVEANETFTLDDQGELNLMLPVGSNVTFYLPETLWYHNVQTATAKIPEAGFNSSLERIVIQAPLKVTFDLFEHLTNGKKDPKKCQLVVTVCNVGRSINSSPQGLPGTVAKLHPPVQTDTYYFGTWGKFSNATNPLPNNRTTVSYDGGVLFENLPLGDYTVTASHPGYTFSSTFLRCLHHGTFLNGAPNQGPRAQPPSLPKLN